MCGLLAAAYFIGVPHTMMARAVLGSLLLATGVSISASSALGVRFLPKGIRSKLIGAARSTFWNSRAGEWVAKLLTPKNRKAVADLDYRPTEMALGLAVEELYAALPRAYREHVPDLPAVVQRLEAHAADARARVDELNALASLGGADATHPADGVNAARDAAKKELADSVAALEAVRLDLLRLHGGATDLRSITTILDAARELGEELDRLGRAQREVNDVVLPLDLPPQKPA